MKKFLRLVSVCLIPGLILVFINVALAGSPLSRNQMSDYAGQSGFNPWIGRAPAHRSLLQFEPITGLAITHSVPTYTNFRIYFTATITGGTPPIGYIWSSGDGPAQLPGSSPVFSHTYDTTGTFNVVVTAFNVVGSVAQTIPLTIEDAPYRVYLPMTWKEFVPPIVPSDLVCDLSLEPADPSPDETFVVSVTIQNLKGGSADGFWVDLYINPSKLPSENDLFPWPEACSPPACPGGIAWGISDTPLEPGITRTLVSIPKNFHPNGFDPAYSTWIGSLPAGTYDLYAYADSIDNPELDDVSGAVFETDEDNNLCKILGLVIPAGNSARIDQTSSNSLPVRPRP